MHISWSLIYHAYIKKRLIEEFFTNATVENIYFSDHHAARIMIENNRFSHCFIKSNMIRQERRIDCFLEFFSNFHSFSSGFKMAMKRDRQYGKVLIIICEKMWVTINSYMKIVKQVLLVKKSSCKVSLYICCE